MNANYKEISSDYSQPNTTSIPYSIKIFNCKFVYSLIYKYLSDVPKECSNTDREVCDTQIFAALDKVDISSDVRIGSRQVW